MCWKVVCDPALVAERSNIRHDSSQLLCSMHSVPRSIPAWAWYRLYIICHKNKLWKFSSLQTGSKKLVTSRYKLQMLASSGTSSDQLTMVTPCIRFIKPEHFPLICFTNKVRYIHFDDCQSHAHRQRGAILYFPFFASSSNLNTCVIGSTIFIDLKAAKVTNSI